MIDRGGPTSKVMMIVELLQGEGAKPKVSYLSYLMNATSKLWRVGGLQKFWRVVSEWRSWISPSWFLGFLYSSSMSDRWAWGEVKVATVCPHIEEQAYF